MTTSTLADRDWNAAQRDLRHSQPFNVALLDDFLTVAALARLREELLEDSGWQVLDWGDEHRGLAERYLHNSRPRTPTVAQVAGELRRALPGTLAGMRLVSHWAILCLADTGVGVHADNASVVINLWLTPDECNLDPASGGLTLFDVKRAPELRYPDFVNDRFCRRYIDERSQGGRFEVPYRCNRATLFDGSTFHATQPVRFSAGARREMRLNLSLAFDEPDALAARTMPAMPTAAGMAAASSSRPETPSFP